MSKKTTVRSFIKVKLRSSAGGISYKDIPIEGKHANQTVEEISLYETEEVETLVQKVVIGGVSSLTVVNNG